MKFIKKHLGPIAAFIITALALILIMYISGIFDNTLLISDLNAEYRPLLIQVRRMLTGEAGFYNFNTGLGDNFIGTFFYYVSSPFNILALFIKDINQLVITLVILKLSLSAVTSYYFFKYQFKEEQKLILITFSIIYALTSYSLSYYLHIMWLDIYMLFPLVLLGVDKIVKEKKYLLFIIAFVASIYCNYYFAYMIAIFCFIYFNYKLFLFTDNKKERFKQNINFIIIGILTVGIASFVMLPIIQEISTYSKSNSSFLNNEDLKWTFNFKKMINHYILGKYDDVKLLNDNDYYLYASAIILPLLYFYFINKKIRLKEKFLSLLVIGLLFVSITCNWANLFWHGFVLPSFFNGRFTFMFILFILLLGIKAMYHHATDTKIIHYIICSIICVGIISIVKISGLDYIKVATIFIFIILLYFSPYSKLSNALILILVMYELTISGYTYLSRYSFIHKDNIDNGNQEVIEYLKEKDNIKYFRIEDDTNRTDNYPLLNNYYGVDYFMSTIKKDSVNFLISLDVMDHGYTKNTISYDGSNTLVSTLLGIKYHVETSNRNLKNYDKVYEIDDKEIYINKYALNLGFMVNDQILKYENNTKDGLDNINNIYYLATGHKPVLKKIKLKPYNDGYVFDNKEDKDIYALAKFKNWYTYDDFKLYIDGENVHDDNGNYMYHIDNNYDEGEINVAYFLQDYNKKDLVGVYLYYFDKEAFEEDVEILKKNQLHVDKMTKNSIEAEIDVDNSNILFTSIPYDKDLHIYIDGKETEPIKLLGTFMGAKIDNGHHNVVIKYIPNTLYKAFVPSFVSIVLMALYLNFDIIKERLCKPKKKSKRKRKKKA